MVEVYPRGYLVIDSTYHCGKVYSRSPEEAVSSFLSGKLSKNFPLSVEDLESKETIFVAGECQCCHSFVTLPEYSPIMWEESPEFCGPCLSALIEDIKQDEMFIESF